MKNQQTHLPTKNMPRCNTITTTVQDAFRPIPGLISCAGVRPHDVGTVLTRTYAPFDYQPPLTFYENMLRR